MSTPLAFALQATRELQKIVQSLVKGPEEPDPFLITLASLLSDVQVRLKQLSESGCLISLEAEKRVLKLLAALETLVRWPSSLRLAPSNPFNRDSYTQLDRLVCGFQQNAKKNIKGLAKSKHERAPTERKKLQASFKNFANIRKPPRGPPLSDLIILNAKPAENDDRPECLRLLYTTLRRYSIGEDGCGGEFRANLALTRVERLEDEKDGVPFNIFLLHRHVGAGCMWKEVQIRVFLQGDSPMPPKVQWLSAAKMISPIKFCGLIRREQRGRLILNAANDGLACVRVELNVEQLKRLFLWKAPSVSLATVLEKRKLDGDDQLKLLLSYLLAKAFWQFYDSNWMTRDWTKHTIHFMRECLNGSPEPQEIITLIHKPFFAAELRRYPSQLNPPSQCESSYENDSTDEFPSTTHSYPKILALGIMLLEIQLGEGIERHRSKDSLDENGRPIENDDHYTAAKVMLSPMWRSRNSYQAVKGIIELCLKPDTGKLGMDQARVRDNLYTYIVAPLDRLFRQAWSRDIDPEAFCPNPVSFKSTEIRSDGFELIKSEATTSSNLEPPVSTQVPSSDSVPTAQLTLAAGSSLNQGGSETGLGLSDSEDGELLDEEDDQNALEARRRKTDRWFLKFQELLIKFDIGRGSEERLKVAILDSGIDYAYFDFDAEERFRIKDTVTFIGGDPMADRTGHGTYIAATILRLTKNVDLYIGKITDSVVVSQREEVAEAIRHARTKWGIHIISLSFGFDSVRYPDNFGEEIRQCLNNDIVVFASASNDGGDGSRTYPAKYARVVCVHSATWQGKVSGFNPGPEGYHNFTVVGEKVRPIWRSKAPTEAGGMKYKSGTSYATPVAVSIAAFMVGYIRKRWPDYPWVTNPRSPEGIARIFQLMSKRTDGYDWISPTRYIKYTRAEKIEGDLKQYLG
ncbi:hypothetical protein AUP68_08458 [Ilyonectria robusta]